MGTDKDALSAVATAISQAAEAMSDDDERAAFARAAPPVVRRGGGGPHVLA